METELLKMQEKHKSHIEELQSHVEGLQAAHSDCAIKIAQSRQHLEIR